MLASTVRSFSFVFFGGRVIFSVRFKLINSTTHSRYVVVLHIYGTTLESWIADATLYKLRLSINPLFTDLVFKKFLFCLFRLAWFSFGHQSFTVVVLVQSSAIQFD